MCLSIQAMILFTSLLPQEIVTHSATEILIEAETGLVVWESFEDQWCTIAPFLTRETRAPMADS